MTAHSNREVTEDVHKNNTIVIICFPHTKSSGDWFDEGLILIYKQLYSTECEPLKEKCANSFCCVNRISHGGHTL